MSSAALYALIVGAGLLAITMLLILRWDRDVPTTESIGDPTQRQVWDERAKKAREDFGLAAIRGIGGKWAQSAAAIVAALSAVAIVAGPDALVNDVGGTEAIVAAALVLAAGAAAAVATLLAALAEQGTPVESETTGEAYRTLAKTRASKAAAQVAASRLLTVMALVLVVAAAGVAWLAALTGEKKPATQKALVVGSSGAVCGALTSADGALGLLVKATVRPIPSDARVTLVESCPEK